MKKKVEWWVIVVFFVCLFMGQALQAKAQEPAPTEAPTVTPTEVPTEAPTQAPTEAPTVAPVTVTNIEVINSNDRVPYASEVKKEDITLLVTYSDNTSDLVHPDSISKLNTLVLGDAILQVFFKGKEVSFPVTVVPRPVTKLRMVEGTKTSMKIGWQPQEEASYFEIFVSKEEEGDYKIEATTGNPYYTFEHMKPGEILYVKVRAVAGELIGDETEVMAIAPTPDKVRQVTATISTQTTVELNWTKAEGATGYAIYYRVDGSDNYKLSGTTTTLSYLVEKLSPGKDYYFVVYAYGADISNCGEASALCFYGTLPGTPTISKIKGGDRRVKVYWKKAAGAVSYRIYISTKADKGYRLMVTVSSEEYLLRNIIVPLQNKKYYVKIEAVRMVLGRELVSVCTPKGAKTKKAKVTSTKAKYYKNKKEFKSSKAYTSNKDFRKKVSFAKSIIIPGLSMTNVAGFNTSRMIPQGMTMAGKYMLVTAYDGSKKTESVIFVIKKKSKKLRTTVVMPYTGHLGGIAYDGVNLWLTYGKKLHSIPFAPIKKAADRKEQFYEVYKINSVCQVPDTASYLTYYKGMLWCGSYHEKSSKYMYAYQINNKNTVPTLTEKHRMRMPNRTQAVVFTKGGKMLVSRSCQTKKGKSGYLCRIDTYKPTWNMSNYTLKKNGRKKKVKMPSMNEGIVISGSYTYVIYESGAFSSCPQHLDRITAFKTSKIS